MPSALPILPVAVIGGGIIGLTAAGICNNKGKRSPFLKQPWSRAARSGLIVKEVGCTRPDPILSSKDRLPSPHSLMQSVWLHAAFTQPEQAKNRYIVRDGKPIALPASPMGFLKTRLFSTRAKFRLLGEPFRSRSAKDCEESVATFVERRLGREFLDYAINPFVGGVYAGDPRSFPCVTPSRSSLGWSKNIARCCGASLDDAALARLVGRELRQLLGANEEIHYLDVRRSRRAIPQYTLGSDRFQEIYSAIKSATPGLFIGGSARDGISIGSCIESGIRLALIAAG